MLEKDILCTHNKTQCMLISILNVEKLNAYFDSINMWKRDRDREMVKSISRKVISVC